MVSTLTSFEGSGILKKVSGKRIIIRSSSLYAPTSAHTIA